MLQNLHAGENRLPKIIIGEVYKTEREIVASKAHFLASILKQDSAFNVCEIMPVKLIF